ncbi:hypothetical protein KSP35_02895 [Aquihabitans sp. G128]|uniref:hypothetical protein n=1 Tax=Aquihabitans sp. G128 TaxID=2849779 RepID=UPI001C227715|nr:hypothetical protein [Aquihabitans sp. G128]QXC61802.1 hypothetical protein KSP35_02895 [Aquihabitans sp. G128]
MRRPVAVVALAALLSVTACSTSGGGSDAGGDGGKTTTTADDGKTTTTEGDTSTTIAPDDDPDQAVADAVNATLDNPRFSVQSEANLTVGAQKFQLTTDGSIDYEGLVADAEITIDGGKGQQGQLKLLADGEKLWINAEGDVGVTIPDGKSWVEGDADLLTSSDNFAPVDLIGVIVALRGADGTKAEGTKEIDGVETQQYSTTLTYDEAVEGAGADAEAFKSALSLTSEKPVDLNIDVWVGDDGIIRTFQLEVDAPSGVPLGGDYTVELTDVGDDVEVPDAPEASKVLTGAKADALLDKLMGG